MIDEEKIAELADKIEALDPPTKALVIHFLDLLVAAQTAGIEPAQIEGSLNRAAMRTAAAINLAEGRWPQ